MKLPINYVEFPSSDLERTIAFYESACGWSFQRWGDEYISFSEAGLEGGFRKAGTSGRGGALVILFAEDLERAEEIIRGAGGVVTVPVFSFPGGRRFHFKDPSGNELAIWSET